MLTAQMPSLFRALNGTLPPLALRQMVQALGNCNQEVTHRGPVLIQPDLTIYKNGSGVFNDLGPTLRDYNEFYNDIVDGTGGGRGGFGGRGVNNINSSYYNNSTNINNSTNVLIGGPPGRDGRDGLDGLLGRDGVNGIDGQRGQAGADGFGAAGAAGEAGPSGPPGDPGGAGFNGRDGRDGEAGEAGAAGAAGVNGAPGFPGLAGRNGRDGRDAKKDDLRTKRFVTSVESVYGPAVEVTRTPITYTVSIDPETCTGEVTITETSVTPKRVVVFVAAQPGVGYGP